MPHPPERFAALDGLRGIAALMVALSHYVLAFQPALLGGGARVAHFAASMAIGQSPAIVLFNPELGVAIFFVLSGFVLAASMARSTMPLGVLVMRRWLRLALPILGTSLLIWPLAEFHLFRSVEAAGLANSDWLGGNYGWLAFESNDPGRLVWQSLVDLFARSRHFYNTALWTMPTEFWGSVGLFAGYAVMRRLAPCRVPMAGLAAAFIVLGLVWKTAYFGFPCGVALFEVRRVLPPVPRASAAFGAAALVLGVGLGGMPFALDLGSGGLYARLFLALGPYIENPVLLMHRVGAVCLVAAAILCPPARDVLAGRLCRYLGRISFMLYLVHVPLLCSLIAASLLKLVPAIGYNEATAVLLPVFLAVAAALATICTWAIDQPTQRFARRAAIFSAPSGQGWRRLVRR